MRKNERPAERRSAQGNARRYCCVPDLVVVPLVFGGVSDGIFEVGALVPLEPGVFALLEGAVVLPVSELWLLLPLELASCAMVCWSSSPVCFNPFCFWKARTA